MSFRIGLANILRSAVCGSARGALAAGLAIGVLAVGARADWSDNFDGGLHNPVGGTWNFTAFSLAATPAEIPGYQPTLVSNLIRIPSPTTGGAAVSLSAGWVASITGTTHQYGNLRLAGTVGVGNNSGLGNNNEVGLLSRLNDFDTYAMVVDYSNGNVNILKSRNTASQTPTLMASEHITGFAPLVSYYLTLDVLDTAEGARTVGRVYQDATKTQLLNTITGIDDFGDVVPEAPLPPYYAGYVAQYNADAPNPTYVDAFIDNMSAQALNPGDVTIDHTVNRRDVVALLHGFGKTTKTTWDDGDVTGTGTVTLSDLMTIQRNLASSGVGVPIDPPVASPNAVPEPETLGLMGIAGLVLAGLRRWRRK